MRREGGGEGKKDGGGGKEEWKGGIMKDAIEAHK